MPEASASCLLCNDITAGDDVDEMTSCARCDVTNDTARQLVDSIDLVSV